MAGKKEKAKGLSLRHEIICIALIAFALYLAVSLFSDSSFSNWGGVIGRHISNGLLKVIGYTAYLLPFIIIAISFDLLLRRILSITTVALASVLIFILSSSALFSAVSASGGAGGVVGAFLSARFAKYLGATGSIIILSAVVIITLLVATGLSLVQAGVGMYPPVAAFFKWIISKASGKAEEAGEEEEEEKTPEQTDEPIDEPVAEKAPQPAPAIITQPQPRDRPKAQREEEERIEIRTPKGAFTLPAPPILDPLPEKESTVDNALLLENSKTLEKKLMDFGVEGRVVEVRPGPVVTMYEFEPASGIKVNRIVALADDLALAMKATSIRIVAPIPGKSVVGIEVPNQLREMIKFREVLESPAFSKSRSRLSLALGKDISGSPFVVDLVKMPHMLVAGATGAGKSVAVNGMILSILFKSTPEDVRFLMVDPKMLELSAYEGIPHLITPVITDPKKAASALRGIVSEMGRRYKLMAMKGAKNIEMYNHKLEEEGDGESVEHKRLPYIVVIIDELADLMMTSGKDVEECLVRLSQMARASGIHLLVATQRPSVDVVTGLIKTNFPARVAFQLPSKTDSRTILDAAGAETLLGSGDMLFLVPGTSKLQRIHGGYVSEGEIKRVTDFWKNQAGPAYESVIIEEDKEGDSGEEDLGEEFLKRYDEAVELASQLEMISTSYLQRRFRIGYNTAARIIEKMEKDGIVGPAQGSRPREVFKRR